EDGIRDWSVTGVRRVLFRSLIAAIGEPGFGYGRPIAAAALAYGLACFWITPSLIRTIAFNWPADTFGYQFAGAQHKLLLGLILRSEERRVGVVGRFGSVRCR